MSGKDFASHVRAAPAPPVNWLGLLGYLNYGEGRPDPRFEGQLHTAWLEAAERAPGGSVVTDLADLLDAQLTILQSSGATAFRDVGQARTAIRAAFRELPRAYRTHHVDLLAHQSDAVLFGPFFLARACEAVLVARTAAVEMTPAQLANDAVARLNDFVGYRPVPVLENRPAGEVYDHERFRPVPLFLRGVGVAAGRYQELLVTALDIIGGTDPELLEDVHFDPQLLDELALDSRAYDHNHPANRRPNHVFGEWDPHHLDQQGRYRRFVVRQNTVDGLLARVEAGTPDDRVDRLFDAAAVLAGTILMASALCGRGPGAHDSTTTLSTLVPRIARLRDRFYDDLLKRTGGPRGERLRLEAEADRQPLGGTRQHLNQVLAHERALQLQERHLALLYAALGYPEASRQRAATIATASVRMAAEARARITTAGLLATRGQPAAAAERLSEAEDIIRRGVACGALADPWSMLGSQGLYPLFQSREDAIHDPRVDELLGLVGDLFETYALAIGEAAALGLAKVRESLTGRMQTLAGWWDQFAGYEIGDLPRVYGAEAAAAAEHVASALTRWRERGAHAKPGSDLAFWREHLEGFRTPAAFARVVSALLDRGDRPAAMGLLLTWVGEAPGVPLEEGDHSFHALARRWASELSASPATPDRSRTFRRFFESLEASAEDSWHVPSLTNGGVDAGDETSDDVFEAAYEGVTFRDSADDGTEGAVLGDAAIGADFPLEHDADRLGGRLQFLATVADLWRTAARVVDGPTMLAGWLAAARETFDRLGDLLEQLHRLPVPEPLAGYEGAVEYDRRRAIREQVTEEALTAAVGTARAIRVLRAAIDGDAGSKADGWEAFAVEVDRSLALRDDHAAGAALHQLLPALRSEPLLYVPLAAGGHPRHILRARSAQAVLHDLMEQLPRLGLLRESFAVVQTARAMEQASPPEGRKVTEFDRLFPVALQTTVHAILDLADSGGLSEAELQAALRRVADPYLHLWVEHSQTIRLSVLESVQSPVEWERLRGFVERYGHELFTAGFLNLASLRSILHRGVSAWLDELPREDEPPERFLAELDDTLPRTQAVRTLETILQAVVENYEEYRDYNTTTTQSDYGENLSVLLDFLRLKAAYERDSWRMRPLVLVHEVLCRRGRTADAAGWQEGIVHYTQQHADRHLSELTTVEERHHLKLRTVRDRIGERFVAPLVIDRLSALLGPAWSAAPTGDGETTPAFARLSAEIETFAATPSGVGLDLPPWLRRLEGEFHRLRHEPSRGDRDKSMLTAEQFRAQTADDWGGPKEE